MLRRKYQPYKKEKGQSTVEYIILVAAIIAALIVFLGPTGVFRSSYNTTLTTGTNGMTSMANMLRNSRPRGNTGNFI